MVAFCCCPRADDFEDYPSYSIYRDCDSLRLFLHQCFSWGTTSIPWMMDTPMLESTNTAHHSVSRPLPFDADQRYSRSQRDGLVSRREKSSTHLQEDSVPLMRNTSSSNVELLSGKTPSGVESKEDDKNCHAQSSGNLRALKISPGVLYVQPSAEEEEDVCPTCLEEYTKANPKITTQCTHHYHLGCIYEWMERSDSCPVCGKEMEFCESP